MKHKWTLKLDTILESDKGNYTCVISNRNGQISWTFTVDAIGKYKQYLPL